MMTTRPTTGTRRYRNESRQAQTLERSASRYSTRVRRNDYFKNADIDQITTHLINGWSARCKCIIEHYQSLVLVEGTLANPEHLAKLKEGVELWNQWRKHGEPWHLRGVDVFTVRDGKVAAKLAYVTG